MTDLESEESLPTFRSFLASSLLQVEQPLLLCVVRYFDGGRRERRRKKNNFSLSYSRHHNYILVSLYKLCIFCGEVNLVVSVFVHEYEMNYLELSSKKGRENVGFLTK